MIEAVSESNLSEVLPLIRKYQEFYNVSEISDSRNTEFFSQFGESSQSGCLFLYRDAGRVVAFATVYFSFASTVVSKVAVMNDLYTLPDFRGRGIGRSLVEYAAQYAKQSGASRLQWVTAPDNVQAQALYDSLEVAKSTWLFYSYPV